MCVCGCARWIEKNKKMRNLRLECLHLLSKWHPSSKSLSYAPRRVPLVTGLQWVEEKEKDPKPFYAMFRMRRSVFYPLQALLVEDYGLESTCNISPKR